MACENYHIVFPFVFFCSDKNDDITSTYLHTDRPYPWILYNYIEKVQDKMVTLTGVTSYEPPWGTITFDQVKILILWSHFLMLLKRQDTHQCSLHVPCYQQFTVNSVIIKVISINFQLKFHHGTLLYYGNLPQKWHSSVTFKKKKKKILNCQRE